MSWFSEYFSGGKNPSDTANQYLNQIPGAMDPYYQPYIQQGQQAGQQLNEQYNQLINDPNALYSKFGEGYKQSPGYQFKLNQALQSGNNAAAAGGMAGSMMHQQAANQTANDIASQDFDQYIQKIMGLYGQGLEGKKGFQEQGYNASMGYGDTLANKLSSQAQYGYAGQAGKNANRSNAFGNIIKLGASFLPGGGALNLLPQNSINFGGG
jgi:hypothetical protein